MFEKVVFLFAFIPFWLNAQNEPLNQLVKGKKNGTWQVYLDSTLNRVENSDAAFFFAYEAYDMGETIFQFHKHSSVEADSVTYSLSWPTKGSPQLLNGVFEWYSSDGNISQHEAYMNGWPWYWKSFIYYKNEPQRCGINEVMDWSKPYNNCKGTFYYVVYWDNEIHLQGWFRKGKRGWRVYEEKSK